jgi:hypothetical protein
VTSSRKLAGVREYARHRGVSHTAVQKAIKTGRIAAAIVRAKGKRDAIDVEAADRLWVANTDQAQQRPPAPETKTPEPETKSDVPETSAPQLDSKKENSGPIVKPGRDLFDQDLEPVAKEERLGDGGGATFASVRVNREVWAGHLAELRYRQVAGELVSAARVRELFFRAFRNVRDGLLSLPVRVSHDLAAETSPARVEERLTKEFETVLQDLSRVELL